MEPPGSALTVHLPQVDRSGGKRYTTSVLKETGMGMSTSSVTDGKIG